MEPKYVAIQFPISFSFLDFPDPTSWALVLNLIGCEHNCIGCHNPDFQKAEPAQTDQVLLHTNTLIRYIDQLIEKEKPEVIVLEGGDPLFSNNEYFTKKLCIEYGSKIPIAVYTGYSIDYVKQIGLTNFQFIKCGKYEEKLKQEPFKNDYEMHLASSNQNFYNNKYEQISENGILKFY
jgi:organic radical activating enzyme